MTISYNKLRIKLKHLNKHWNFGQVNNLIPAASTLTVIPQCAFSSDFSFSFLSLDNLHQSVTGLAVSPTSSQLLLYLTSEILSCIPNTKFLFIHLFIFMSLLIFSRENFLSDLLCF